MAEITVAAGRCWQYSPYIGRSATAGAGFRQPVGVAAGRDGMLYVANRSVVRITKTTVDQEFITEFGRNGQEELAFEEVVADEPRGTFEFPPYLRRWRERHLRIRE